MSVDRHWRWRCVVESARTLPGATFSPITRNYVNGLHIQYVDSSFSHLISARVHSHNLPVMSVLDAHLACNQPSSPSLGEMYVGSFYGFAATILSLATNLAATSVIAYKAWYVLCSHVTCCYSRSNDSTSMLRQHRRFIKANLRRLSGRTQVQRVMGVLVESGVAYCALRVRLPLQGLLLAWSGCRLQRLSSKLPQAFVFALQLYKRSPDFTYSASANGERLDWLAVNFLPAFFTPFIVSVVFCMVPLKYIDRHSRTHLSSFRPCTPWL